MSKLLASATPKAGRVQVGVSAKRGMTMLGLAAMFGSAVYWWSIQSALTNNGMVAAVFTAVLTVAPPAIMSCLVPSTRAGMLLQKLNVSTYAYPVSIMTVVILLGYTGTIQWIWWQQQVAVSESGMALMQVIVGMLGFVVIPALFWTPVTAQEVALEAAQAAALEKLQLQHNADIAILETEMAKLYAQAARDLVNQADKAGLERGFVDTMIKVVKRIDGTMDNMGQIVERVADINPLLSATGERDGMQHVLRFIADNMKSATPLALPDLASAQRRQIASTAASTPAHTQFMAVVPSLSGHAPVVPAGVLTPDENRRYNQKGPGSGRLRVQQ